MGPSPQEKERLLPMLLHPLTMGTVLYSICVRLYGSDFHEWEPETLGLELKDDFGVELPPINLDKIHALVSVVTSHGFYTDWSAFNLICMTLNNEEGVMEGADPILGAEMAWGVIEARMCDDKPHEWSHEVRRFVGRVLENEGFCAPPPHLDFAVFAKQYHGSDSAADLRKQDYLSTEHGKVIDEYIKDQSLLLIKQIGMLPWHNVQTLDALSKQLRED